MAKELENFSQDELKQYCIQLQKKAQSFLSTFLEKHELSTYHDLLNYYPKDEQALELDKLLRNYHIITENSFMVLNKQLQLSITLQELTEIKKEVIYITQKLFEFEAKISASTLFSCKRPAKLERQSSWDDLIGKIDLPKQSEDENSDSDSEPDWGDPASSTILPQYQESLVSQAPQQEAPLEAKFISKLDI